MKFRKGDKIFWDSKPKKATEYDVIIGVVDKKYYAIGNWYRSNSRQKFRGPNLMLTDCKTYEFDVETDEATIQRRKK